MKYETPQMTALTPAVNAIQETSAKALPQGIDYFEPSDVLHEVIGAYTDWE